MKIGLHEGEGNVKMTGVALTVVPSKTTLNAARNEHRG
jgi:hypothetical protein